MIITKHSYENWLTASLPMLQVMLKYALAIQLSEGQGWSWLAISGMSVTEIKQLCIFKFVGDKGCLRYLHISRINN